MRKYDDLTHRGQFQRLGRLGRVALQSYDIGTDVRIIPLRHIENTTFRVDDPATGRRYCLRLHRPGYQTTPAIRSEMQFLDALARETDLIVPRPVPTRDGDLLTSGATEGIAGERTVVLFEWVYGRFLGRRLSPDLVARSGATMARLHRFAESFVAPPDFTRPILDSNRFLGQTLGESLEQAGSLIAPEDRAVIERAFAQASDVQATRGHDRQVYGLIHADYHRGNFLVAPGGVIAVIDFDDCGWGHYLLDLAAATNHYANSPETMPLRDAFLRGYRTVRELSVEDEQFLPAFYLLRGVFLLQWVLARTDNPALRDWLPQSIAKTVATAQRLLSQ